MIYSDTFSEEILQKTLARLDNLKVDTKPDWGKMNAAQMLSHVNVAYDLAYGRREAKLSPLKKWLVKKFVKPIVVGDKPYPRNTRTAPVFVVRGERDFEKEKSDLIENLKTTVSNGAEYFEGKENSSFGSMKASEWNQMFQKHLEHHFNQFAI